jgi:hypothetical protein
MNRKRRSKICCLSGILLLILLLAGVQRVSAMTTRTELYQNTPSDGGRSDGKEKQLLANSYAWDAKISLIFAAPLPSSSSSCVTNQTCSIASVSRTDASGGPITQIPLMF